MALVVTDVLNYLEDQTLVAGATGWIQSANFLPPSPDQVIAVFDTPGTTPEKKGEGSSETEYDEGGFQVRGRGAEFGGQALRLKMGTIFRSLHGSILSPTTGDPVYIYVLAITSAPLPMGLDENSRPGFTWNFKYMRERET